MPHLWTLAPVLPNAMTLLPNLESKKLVYNFSTAGKVTNQQHKSILLDNLYFFKSISRLTVACHHDETCNGNMAEQDRQGEN